MERSENSDEHQLEWYQDGHYDGVEQYQVSYDFFCHGCPQYGHKRLNTLKSTTTSAFNSIKSTVSSAMSSLRSMVSSGVANIRSSFNSLGSIASSAYRWGADICSQMAAGVRAAASSVIAAAENVASRVRSLLHFSVPDEGPLSDADTYMPDFMKLLATGIKKMSSRW